MTKIPLKGLNIFLAILIAFNFVLGTVVFVLNKNQLFIYLLKCNMSSFLYYIIVALNGIAVCALIFVNFHNKLIIALSVVLLVLGLGFTFLLFTFFTASYDAKYFEFKSDSKTIIVEKWSWLLAGGSNVYQKVNPFIMVYLDGYIGTDDGYRPFSNNDYNIEWEESAVIITYGFGNPGVEHTERFALK